jgi:hypothetical protein
MSITSMTPPRWGRISQAVERSGVRRGKLYQLGAQHAGLFRKLDSVTLVDLQMLDEILAELPAAELNTKTA